MAGKAKKGTAVAPSKGGELAPAYDMGAMEAALAKALGRKVTIAKMVTMPTIRHKEGETVAIKITGPMHIGKTLKDEVGADGRAKKREPATVVECINLANDQPSTYICTAVFKGNLEDVYPDNSYVGKAFAIYKGKIGEGKSYRDMQIVEIAV